MVHNCWCICHDTDTDVHPVGVSVFDRIEAITACSKCAKKHSCTPRIVKRSPIERLLAWREYIGGADDAN